ncbi:hypothetical protein [Paenibacillus naphthalenovorans]|uniref:Uncharacterized protein n=1 Tax=Paenibacillus naphthalenovorans TaxID=162209 RepID=A0A0U2VFQ3_9BACL|nr:hypothetical protein [Paenibacillus naphthalenovorans]ALS22323.1 hypothetical protein IJ22_19490 [Paenibacillus naphthalenovorans]
MKKYYDHINKIKYDYSASDETIEKEIQVLIQRLHDEQHMSMVRSIVGDTEIIIIKQIHEDSREYLRISVNRNREELLMRLSDFNLLFNTNIPSSLPESECEECNKKNE